MPLAEPAAPGARSGQPVAPTARPRRGASTAALGEPRPVTGSQPGPAWYAGVGGAVDDHGVVPRGDVVERLAVPRAAGDPVEDRVDEAQVVAGQLVRIGHQPAPERGGGAGAACRTQVVAPAAGLNRQRHAGPGVAGHVRHAPCGLGTGDAVLVGGAGEDAAEPAARGEVPAPPHCLVPGRLPDVGAGLRVGGEGGAADAQHERIGGGQADLLDRRGPEVVDVAHRPRVTAGGDHRHVPGRGLPQDAPHLGNLGR